MSQMPPPPQHNEAVGPMKWLDLSVARWHVLVPVLLGAFGVFMISSIMVLTVRVRQRALRKRAVPYYWSNMGKTVNHGEDKRHKDYFDDSIPLSAEQRLAIQDLMNKTCGKPDEQSFRLIRAVRVESSALWVRYRRRVRDILEDRGQCEWRGEGEPRIREAVVQLDDAELEPFSQRDMVADACEAFLWLGTKPETAMKLISAERLEGSECVGNAARFGMGWYFAEDVAAAHNYAESGQNLYRESYAMLLCRVVLGRQNPVDCARSIHRPSLTADERDIEAAAAPVAQASSSAGTHRMRDRITSSFSRIIRRENRTSSSSNTEFDSTLAEIPGEPREFIVYDCQQVYPEFALIYEACHPDHLENGMDPPTYWDHATSMIFGTIYPPYWMNARSHEGFHDMFPALRFNATIQDLARDTWKNKWTRDRLGSNGLPLPKGDPLGEMPKGIQVLKAWRVENSAMWERYNSYRRRIQASRGTCKDLSIKTTAALSWNARRRLTTQVNEAYLWHGSKPTAVLSIATEGFNVDLSGSNVGAMFGKGAYFAECSSKADEYSRDDKEGYFEGCYACVLCRVVLGEAQVLQKADYSAHARVGEEHRFDSTVGDRESAVGTYREFVVPAADAIYPEYAIIYERVAKPVVKPPTRRGFSATGSTH